VKVRRWLGAPAIYHQADPRLETALTSIQSAADGGTRPDNSTETAIRGYITTLETLEAQRTALVPVMVVGRQDDSTVDALRAKAGIENLMRQQIGHICDALSMRGPYRDVLTSVRANPNPFHTN
jgi:hypothetical protein